MIEFTIKTLDSNNHHFSVDDETTVQQLKEKVREQMGIEITLQRLIFCGRVLQDEKKLSEYDVNGKVVHLVQRAPPSPEPRHSTTHAATSTNNTPNSDTNMQQQIRRLMALAGPPDFVLEQQQAMSMSPTTGRLEFIRRLIGEIKTSLSTLRAQVEGEENRSTPASSEAPVESTDNEPAVPVVQEEQTEQQLEEPAEDAPDPVVRAQNVRRRSYRAIRALRARHSRPRDLGQLLDELDSLQQQFAPYRASYVRLLRAANNPEPPQYTEEERQNEQRTVDLVSDIMHSFAHAYHAVSDINFQVGQRNPRLSSEASVVRHPLPMQAHINVVQSNRRPPQPQGTAPSTNGNGTGGPAPATQTSASAAPATDTNPNSQGAQGNQASAQAGRNPTQPTVNINIQPDPITYQVEIETRVPIAFPLENALLNGMTNPAVATNQQEPNSQNQNQSGQQGQANRRQVLLDFENLFRGLSQTGGLGGVEVVMSMEEIPHGGALGVGTFVAGANANGAAAAGAATAQQPPTDGGVYLAPMPWGGPPSADLLQNIVSSVIRQGLVPGVEGVTLHVPQGQGQVQQVQVPITQVQQGPGPQGPQTNAAAQGGQDQNNQNTQNAQPSLHLRRATTTTRAQAVSLANLIYDRFLTCDSPHARRRLQRRREQHQQQVAAQERVRAERTAAQNIEALSQRNSTITGDHMQTLVQLLRSTPSQEAWFNALMVTVARHLFLPEALQAVAGEPVVVPSEFTSVRLILRNYIQNLLARSGLTDAEQAFMAVADNLVAEYEDFIDNMPTLTSLREDIDVYGSLRALIRSRFPAVIATVMSDASGEMFAARFYSVFSRLLADVCAIIYHCCHDGPDGLRIVYRAFMEHAIQRLDESAQDMLMTLSMENLTGILANYNMATQVGHIRQYIRRRAGFPPTPTRLVTHGPTPMEVSPQAVPVREEPMQTSPPATPSVVVEPAHPPSVSPVPEEPEVVAAEPIVAPVLTSVPHTMVAAAPEVAVASPTLASTSTASTATAQNCTVTSNAAQSPVSSPVRTPTKNSKPENTDTVAMRSNSADNIRFVPPMVIVQHWGEEWVPVFTRDQQAQRADPPEPYSDAYLSGMPSRKRRCVRQARPPTTLDGFMNESVREAADRERAATADNSAIRIAFREHMRNMARSRASSSEDYDPRRYTSAERFLNTTKPNVPQHPESSSVSEDKA